MSALCTTFLTVPHKNVGPSKYELNNVTITD